MCRGCDVDTGPGWGQAWAESTRNEQAGHTHLRNALLQRLLSSYSYSISQIDITDSFRLSGPTGKTAIAHGARSVWPVFEEMSGRQIDVLDPRVIERASGR